MANDKILPMQILLPVLLLSLAVAGSFTFQSVVMFGDHTALKAAYAQQEKPLQDIEKLRTQVSSLAMGTLKLSQQGDKNAQVIVDQLKKAGIKIIDEPQAATPATAAVPAPAAQ